MTDAPDRLAQIEAKREEKRAARAEAYRTQRAIDLEAVDALEDEHGASNICTLDVPFSPGMVTLIAARTPSTGEVKRYRDRLRPKGADGKMGDTVAAAEEVAACCRVYPDGEAYKLLLDARPGIHVQLGSAAVRLAAAREAEESKS